MVRRTSELNCPSCRQRLRVPSGHRRIRVTCPTCRHVFECRTREQREASLHREPSEAELRLLGENSPEQRDQWGGVETAGALLGALGGYQLARAVGAEVGFAAPAAILLWYLAGRLANRAMNAWRRYHHRRKVCAHGVRGGTTTWSCSTCRRERLQQKRRIAAEQEEERRKKRLTQQAAELRRKEIARLRQARARQLDDLRNLTSQGFEALVADMFRRQGYQVTLTPAVNDGGKDVIITRAGRTLFVECKKYGPTTTVGRPDLQQLLGAVTAEGADGGVFVTTGRYSAAAREFATAQGIRLITASEVVRLMRAAYPDSDPDGYSVLCTACGEKVRHAVNAPATVTTCACGQAIPPSIRESDLKNPVGPTCPHCGSSMRRRAGRRGRFWGCSRYPDCRGTRSMR